MNIDLLHRSVTVYIILDAVYIILDAIYYTVWDTISPLHYYLFLQILILSPHFSTLHRSLPIFRFSLFTIFTIIFYYRGER